jgi:hypothetical protein
MPIVDFDWEKNESELRNQTESTRSPPGASDLRRLGGRARWCGEPHPTHAHTPSGRGIQRPATSDQRPATGGRGIQLPPYGAACRTTKRHEVNPTTMEVRRGAPHSPLLRGVVFDNVESNATAVGRSVGSQHCLTRTSHRCSSRGRRGAVHSGVFDPRGAESYSSVRRAHRGEKTLLGGVHRRPQQEAGEKCGLRGHPRGARWGEGASGVR